MSKENIIKPKSTRENILVIPDLHEPFSAEGFLEFCIEVKKKYKCIKIIFIGDILDNHAAAFWTSDPDGYSAGNELDLALDKIKLWYKHFPNAYVTIGNHDQRVMRKIFDAGIPKRWIKEYKEVLKTPKWKFVDHHDYKGIRFLHGTGTSGANAAVKRMNNLGMSVVMGHIHAHASITYNQLGKKLLFGALTGCGVDQDSYSMVYGKQYPKQMILSCLVIVDGIPTIIPFRKG